MICFLTLSEILDLDLGAQMVVLANGHAGRGQAMMGQGVINWPGPFSMPGPEAPCINLWDIKAGGGQGIFYKILRVCKGRQKPE